MTDSGSSEFDLTTEDAMARLNVVEDYDPGGGPGPCVHTLAEAAFGLLGAHWRVDDVRDFFDRHGAVTAGPMASAMQHGVACVGDGRRLYFATKPQESA